MPKPSILEFDALGTHWWLTFYSSHEHKLSERIVLQYIKNFEQQYSRFISTSLISKLNHDKLLVHTPDELLKMLSTALRHYDHTQGLFNISVGSELERKGYGYHTDETAHLSTSLRDDLLISDSTITIAPHVRLDLGGIGKGWAIDKLYELLTPVATVATSGFIINGGGDIRTHLFDDTVLALEHPRRSDEHIGTITVQDESLACSSIYKRTWKKNGSVHSHIITTSSSGDYPYVASFVRSKTSTTADVLATVLLLASDTQRETIMKNFQAEYLLIKEDMSFVHSAHFNAQLF